jgi:hypothetical protein
MAFRKLMPDPLVSQKLTPDQLSARARPPPNAPSPRPALAPVDRGSELWQRVFKAALKTLKIEDAEKMADTAILAREKSLALVAGRHKLILTKDPPKPSEACASAPAKKGRGALHAAFRCKAFTLEGKQCGFKATCGDFCRKHACV